jgi:hypothetical protein
MGSLMKNDGMKFPLNHNDTFSRYQNKLNDLTEYPYNLSQIDYQLDLFYPQTSVVSKNKKRKKIKDVAVADKPLKDVQENADPSRNDIIIWYRILNMIPMALG